MSATLQWVLHAQANIKRGVAKPYAVPAVLAAGFPPICLSLDEVLEWTRGGPAPVVRGKPLEAASLEPLGIVGERYRDGTRLAGSAPLSADEVLRQYCQRLPGPWDRVYSGESDWLASGTAEEIATAHLGFLRRWGLSGGIVGRWTGFERHISAFLDDWLAECEDMRMLVVADRSAATALAERLRTPYLYLGKARESGMAGEPPQGCVICTPQALVMHEGMSAQKWDVAVFLELDTLYPSTASKAFRVMSMLRGGQRIGLVSKPLHALRTREQRAATTLLRASRVRDWPYVVRDSRPCQRPSSQPPSARTSREDMLRRTYDDASAAYLRREGIPFLNMHGPSYAHTDTAFERFLRQSEIEPARTPPYVAFPPPMAKRQLYDDAAAYYARWRQSFREGAREPTEDPYMLVYAMQLLSEAEQRKRMDKQAAWDDLYALADLMEESRHAEQVRLWALDFACLHLPADALWIAYGRVRDILPDAVWLNAYLYAHRATVRFADLTDGNLARLAGGDASPSRPTVRQALDALDAAYMDAYGAPLLASFSPVEGYQVTARAYENSAVYCQRSIKLTFLPYTHHAPLRGFLTEVCAYVEDAQARAASTRKRKPAKTKLEAFVCEAIDEAFGLKPKPPQPRVISVDMARALALERESRLVREALIVDIDAQEERSADGEHSSRADEGNDARNPMPGADASSGIVNAELSNGNDASEKGKGVPVSNPNGGDLDDVGPTDGAPSIEDPQARALLDALSPRARACLLALVRGDAGAFESTARALGRPPAALLDEINEAAQEAMGDLLLEEDEGGHARVLEEYRGWFG